MQITFEAEVTLVSKFQDKYHSTASFKSSPEKYSLEQTIRIPQRLELGTKLFVTVSDKNPTEENENISRFNDQSQAVDYPVVGEAASKTIEHIRPFGLDKGEKVVLD